MDAAAGMLLVTESGHSYSVMTDAHEGDVVWVRSQDRGAVEAVVAVLSSASPYPDWRVDYKVLDKPEWDYRYRVKLTRALWAKYLAMLASEAPGAGKAGRSEVASVVERVIQSASERGGNQLPPWVK